jgi:N-acetylglucosamine-6-phosphate deacetylase
MSTLIRGARVVGPEKVERRDLLIADGVLVAADKPAAKDAGEVDADGLYALPGFVDVHVHGGIGFDATSGVYDRERGAFDASRKAYARALPELMDYFAGHGVARVLLATFAAPMKELERACGALADYAEDPRNGRDGAALEGILIEGAFIKNPDYAGAQNPRNFMYPALAKFEALQQAARGWIKYVNIVPEYGEAAEKLIAAVAASGVAVGMAHTSERAVQVRRCAEAGLAVCLHFLNGPTGSSTKPFGDGNVVEEVLTNPKLQAELICDGWHVSPRYVVDVVRRMGFDRILAVSDASFPANMEGLGEFELGGVKGRVGPHREYLEVVGKKDALFGSMLTLDKAFANLVSWQTAGLEGVWSGQRDPTPLDDALVNAARATATNPARLVGLDRTRPTGVLAEGNRADVVLAELKGHAGDYTLEVRETFVGGRRVL